MSAVKLCPQCLLRCAFLAAISLCSVGSAFAQAGDLATADLPGRSGAGVAPVDHPPASQPAPAEQPAKKVGYSGLRLRQNPEGVVASGVQPGPLGGDGFKSPSIWRGDLIVSINGQSLDAAGYRRVLKSLTAGDTLRVLYRRGASADPYSAVPQGDLSGEERSIEIILDDAAKWSGTIGQGVSPGHVIAPTQSGEFEDFILNKAQQLGLRTAPGGVDALLAHLSSVQQSLLAPNSLPAVVQAFQRPLSLDRVEVGPGVTDGDR